MRREKILGVRRTAAREAIHARGEIYFEIVEKCVHAILFFLGVNAQQQKGLRLVFVEVRIQLRHFFAARAAPGGEKVEHNDFLADDFGELKARTASGFELEIGRNSALPFRAVGHVLSVLLEELLIGSGFKDVVQDPEQ